jgi:DNA-binding ferritin-like protein
MAERTLKGTQAVATPGIKRKSTDMSTLIAELMHAATKTHMAHLKTKSYAAHMALGEFYETLPGMIDTVAEQWQGLTGSLLSYPALTVTPINTPEEAATYLQELHATVTKVQESITHSEIVNELDVIKSCIDKTVYKLKFLK